MTTPTGIVLLIITTLILSISCLQKSPKEYYFNFDSHMIPHPQKAHRGGQDAFFNSSKMLVVADGVGGWNNQGIDPSKYSRFLCAKAQEYVAENQTLYTTDPKQVIIRAQKENENMGSSTMVVVTLDEKFLKYCYIGGRYMNIPVDSGFMLIRKYQKLITIFQYVEQQHSFNFPFQLAMSTVGGDDPKTSICGSIETQEGDIIVVGSDGLYDNMQFHQVFTEVEKAVGKGKLLSGLAKQLAETAIKRGGDNKFNSPFAQRAKKYKLRYTGGKLDDTTVIVAEISSSKKPTVIQEL